MYAAGARAASWTARPVCPPWVADEWGQQEWGRCKSHVLYRLRKTGTPWHFWEDKSRLAC